MPWRQTEYQGLNYSIDCPHFCTGLIQHCGVCGLCVRAGFIHNYPHSTVSLPIRILAQISLINTTLTETPHVTRAFHILGGRDWDSFLLAYLDLHGSETAPSAAASISTSILILSITAFLILRICQN